MHEAYPQAVTAAAIRRHEQDRITTWYGLMVNAHLHMSPEAQAVLDEWEHAHPGLATSDWPGWADYIDMAMFWPWPWPQGAGPAEHQQHSVQDRTPREGFHLYRLWDDQDRLIYVGVSTRLRARLRVHRRRLAGLWVRASWVEYPDAASMLAAERDAIEAEAPALNHQGVG